MMLWQDQTVSMGKEGGGERESEEGKERRRVGGREGRVREMN
jgi:hypothetical protein